MLRRTLPSHKTPAGRQFLTMPGPATTERPNIHAAGRSEPILSDGAEPQHAGTAPWLPESQAREPAPPRRTPCLRPATNGGGRGVWLGLASLALSFVCTLLLSQGEPVRTAAWLGLLVA